MIERYGSRVFTDIDRMVRACPKCGLPKLKQDMRQAPDGRWVCLGCASKLISGKRDEDEPLIKLKG